MLKDSTNYQKLDSSAQAKVPSTAKSKENRNAGAFQANQGKNGGNGVIKEILGFQAKIVHKMD